jgi:serine O-acetyltransferase
MIDSKSAYEFYLHEDIKALGIPTHTLGLFSRFFELDKDIWRFQKALRRCEYYFNLDDGSFFWKSKKLIAFYRFKRLSLKLGFTIMPNSIGPGLRIMQRGTIVINGKCRIGSNCTLNVDVNIGTNAGFIDKCPMLGNGIYIGPGAKLFGDIFIADDCAIGANAVVNKSFLSKGTIIAGVPAVDKGILNRELSVY